MSELAAEIESDRDTRLHREMDGLNALVRSETFLRPLLGDDLRKSDRRPRAALESLKTIHRGDDRTTVARRKLETIRGVKVRLDRPDSSIEAIRKIHRSPTRLDAESLSKIGNSPRSEDADAKAILGGLHHEYSLAPA